MGSVILFCTPAFAAGFSDLQGHWAAGEIQKAVAEGYLKGYPDGTFQPDRVVTRAEFVALVNGAFQVKPSQKVQVSFKDVKPGDWFAPAVEAALAAGYIEGYPDGTFRPQKAVNRQEAACLLAKLLKLEGEGNIAFTDAGKIAAWARPAVAALVAKGIMGGYPDGTFRPARSITRAEAAALVGRAREGQEVTPVAVSLVVVEEIVNVRSGPGTSYQVLGQVRAGDTLQARGRSGNNWYEVDFGGGRGWIAGWLVQVAQAPPPSRDEPGTLEVKVERQARQLVVTLVGNKDASYLWEEKANPQRLVVAARGVTVVRTPLEINVREAGLERIVTSFPAEEPGTAEVELLFEEHPLPVFYQVDAGAPGEFRVTLPNQIMQAETASDGETLLITLRGTAPLAYQSFSLSGPKRLVFDFNDFVLHPALLGWEQEANLPEFGRVRLGQFQPDVARLVVETTRGASFAAQTRLGGRELLLSIRTAGLAGRRVVLDPGHGGRDPGAIGPGGVQEKDVNLAIALQARDILRQQGVDVILTRNGDQEKELPERAQEANNSNAEVFVSIHANSANNAAIGGTATYTYAPPNTALGLQREARFYLAQLLQEELVRALGLRDAGIYEANFAVLRYTAMPAVLVEVAFLSNPAEEQLLVNPEFQGRAAAAIAQAIIRFLTE
ncbi:MAG: N-acetylmuramoyl-L-alanine amidase [Bacillota bacterium]|nr:N-acetylmuramoyl-L-alanine amidase [Bacillota bacterium]